MTSTSATANDASTLWEYVPVAGYELPAAPVTHTARKGLADFRRFLRREDPQAETRIKSADELRTVAPGRLERLAPAPAWDDAAEALDVELGDWRAPDQAAPAVMVLVGPPHSNHRQILRAWAERQSWPELPPPSPEQVLAGADTWLADRSEADGPWVLAALEKACLRHVSGLSLIRRFLDRAYSGDLGPGIIGCDSWCWAYLTHIWHGRKPVTLALQAFDQARLSDYFQQLADSSGDDQLYFRQSNNGRYVLPPPPGDEDSPGTSNFLQLLAAHCRGNLGLARAVWRAALRVTPEETGDEEMEPDQDLMPHQTIWVTPWDRLEHPSLPAGSGRDEAFVLHTLLLHGGLSPVFLRQLLPLSPDQTTETLFRLEEAGLVSQQDAEWQVTPLGYPAVREFLQAGGYLVDQF